LFYAALEPHVRRYWPEALVSWSRVLLGRVREPRLGQDLLLGTLVGIAGILISQCHYCLALAVNPPWAPPPLGGRWFVLLGPTELAGEILYTLSGAVEASVVVILVLTFLRVICRKGWIGNAVLFVVLSLALTYDAGGNPALTIVFVAAKVGLALLLLSRCGLVALVTMFFVMAILRFPLTVDSSKWYFESALLAVGVVALIGLVGYGLSLAGRLNRSLTLDT
jgi:hypothetical protein